MHHGDDKGLVLPPRVARYQVVIIPVIFKDADLNALAATAKEILKELTAAGIRVTVDDRDNYHPGWKFNHWELKGVPLRFEVGPKEVQNNEVRVVRRVDGDKLQLKRANLAQDTTNMLEAIQKQMFDKAKQNMSNKIKTANDWKTFMTHLNAGNAVLVPW